MEEYYYKLLEHNCKNYKSELFDSQKGKDGKYFEYTVEEIVEKIYEKNEKGLVLRLTGLFTLRRQ